MIPAKAIELAKKNGWKIPHGYRDSEWQIFCLQSSFWQSLGKSLGWTMNDSVHVDCANAHDFYDLILTEQPTDKFWADLLDDNEQRQ